MPAVLIETDRLVVRAFERSDATAYQAMQARVAKAGSHAEDAAALAETQAWLAWSNLCHTWFPKMGQPPYGDRAVVHKASGELVGTVGYVPCLAPFDQLPDLRDAARSSGLATTEFGLFWMIDPRFQRQGYATEAARALIERAFRALRLKRIIATTADDNLASQAVMRKLGMTLLRNPLPEPRWLQVVGVLNNKRGPHASAASSDRA